MHVKDQHIVPQFLLRNFSNSNGTHVWSFDKYAIKERWPNIKNRSIKSTHTVKYFYDEVKGKKENSFEYELGKIEDKTEPIISKLNDHKKLSLLTFQEKRIISQFVSFQIFRTKEALIESERFLNEFYTPIEELTGEKIERDLNSFWLENLKSAKEFTKYLLDKTWILAESNNEFFISDNPITLQNTINPSSHRGTLGLNSLGIEIHFPISSSICLCMYCNKTVPNSIPNIQCSPENIENMNWLQVKYSERFIFSASNNFELIEKMIEENSL